MPGSRHAVERLLQVGDSFTLPATVVTSTMAILGVSGSGKSNTAAVMAEEMFSAGLPWVAVDPKGDWWGLRSAADGSGPGLAVPVFGGLHGDLPLTPDAGSLMAEVIVEANLTCVLDVSEFDTKAAQVRFLTDFGERLYRLHGRDPVARHVFVEEADEIVPQRVMPDMARCVGAWSKLVRRGRQRGLGVSLISQRSAVVNKDCLTQTSTLIALRATSPQDRKAIRDWVDYHQAARELVESLPNLPDGEAWVVSPQQLGVMERVRFRQRATFDSGATPAPGAARRSATLADIDVEVLRGRLAAVVEVSEASDPKVLQARIVRLEAELARLRAERPAPERVEVPVEVVVEVPDASAMFLAVTAADTAAALRAAAAGMSAALEAHLAGIESAAAVLADAAAAAPAGTAAPEPPKVPRPARQPADAGPNVGPPPSTSPQQPAAARPGLPAGHRDPAGLPKAQRAVLTVLAQHPDGRSKRQLAMQAGYSAGGGGFNNALSALRTAGLITKGEPIRATADGVAALGDGWEPLPTGRALFDHWVGQVGKAERLVLEALAEVWPAALTKDELAARTGYSAGGGGFNNALSRLRTLQLVDGRGEMTLDPTLGAAL